jgi:hypothetical protein
MCTTGNSIPFVTMSTVLWKGSNLSGVDICLPENSDNCRTMLMFHWGTNGFSIFNFAMLVQLIIVRSMGPYSFLLPNDSSYSSCISQ